MNRASTGDPIPDAQLSTDVLIVGGGPIGLALALHLDMYGVRSTIFNAEPEARWHPKGNIHNARTMELFRKVGIADRIRALGLPGDHPFDVAYFTRLNAYEIARGRTPSRDERLARRLLRPATDQLPEPTHRVNQMYVEWIKNCGRASPKWERLFLVVRPANFPR
jgi:FAD binding domain